MSDIESRLRESGQDVRNAAVELATSRPWPTVDRGSTTSVRRTRVLVRSIAAGIVGLGLVALLFTRSSTPAERSAPDAPSTRAVDESVVRTPESPATTVDAAVSEPVSSDVPPATEAAAPVTAVADMDPVLRPVFDPAVCDPVSAAESGLVGLPLHPNRRPVTVFGWPSTEPVPVQVFGIAGDGVAGPYAVVAHLRSDRDLSGDVVENSDAQPFRSVRNDDGSLDFVWELPDGTVGVLRSRELDPEVIEALILSLEPRATTGAPGGFELTADVAGLATVAEELNTEMASGGVGSTCVTPGGESYRVWRPSGSDAYNYLSTLARPMPAEIAQRGGDIWIISGPDVPGAPTAAQLRDADEAEWSALLEGGAASVSVVLDPGSPSAIALTPIGDASPSSTVEVRVESESDRASLHVATSDTTVPSGAAFWVTVIDGRIEGISSIAGGTLAHPVTGDQFDVLLAAVDVDGLPVAATDELAVSVVDR